MNIQTTTLSARPSDEEELRLFRAILSLQCAQKSVLKAVAEYNACQHDRTLDIEAISNTFHDEIGEVGNE